MIRLHKKIEDSVEVKLLNPLHLFARYSPRSFLPVRFLWRDSVEGYVSYGMYVLQELQRESKATIAQLESEVETLTRERDKERSVLTRQRQNNLELHKEVSYLHMLVCLFVRLATAYL
jgi:hypothetical protein